MQRHAQHSATDRGTGLASEPTATAQSSVQAQVRGAMILLRSSSPGVTRELFFNNNADRE